MAQAFSTRVARLKRSSGDACNTSEAVKSWAEKPALKWPRTISSTSAGPIPASALAAGHGGASGTRIHLDPARDLVAVFLSGSWYGDEAAQWGTFRRVYAAWDDEEARAG